MEYLDVIPYLGVKNENKFGDKYWIYISSCIKANTCTIVENKCPMI